MPRGKLRTIVGRLGLVVALAVSATIVAAQSAGAEVATGTAAVVSAGTTVGGVMKSDTRWTVDRSPYLVTKPVQIPAGVTLTIDPGVRVEGRLSDDDSYDGIFILKGNLSAAGTASAPIQIDGGGARLVTAIDSDTESLTLFQHTRLTNGREVWFGGSYELASLHLLDSVVTQMSDYSYIWYTHDSQIKGNIFYDAGGFTISGAATLENNRFEGAPRSKDWAMGWVSSETGVANVNHNSFDPAGGVAVWLAPDYDGEVDATSNDWGTTNTSVIESMIYDDNDNIRCAGEVPFLPVLSAPHAATPAGQFFGTKAPSISGKATVGSTLTASAGTWGPQKGATVKYQWYRDGSAITGATSTKYIPTAQDLGHTFTFSVTASRAHYTSAKFTSAPTTAITAGMFVNTAVPTITGTAKVGSPLKAASGSWSPAPTAVKYQWKANNTTISGATASTYKIPASLAGKKLTVTVTASRTGYAPSAKTSRSTVAVAAGTLSAAPTPKISGSAKVGSTLKVTTGAWGPAPVALKYQWRANGIAIRGATAAKFTVPASVAGKKISVMVTGSKAGYKTTTKTSARTVAISR